MFQPKSWFLWVFIFMGSVLIGMICYFLLFSYSQKIPFWSGSFEPVVPDLHPKHITNQHSPNIKVTQPLVHQTPTPVSTEKINLINPFVIPGQYNASKSHFPKKPALLEYLGTVETDNDILGLIRINNGESFVVSEGEDLVISGIVIGKITPTTLTYSQNGIEKVIHLGGTSN